MANTTRRAAAGTVGAALLLSLVIHLAGGAGIFALHDRKPHATPEPAGTPERTTILFLTPSPLPPTPTPEPTPTPQITPTPTPEPTPTPTPPPPTPTPPPDTPPPETPAPITPQPATPKPAPPKKAAAPRASAKLPPTKSNVPKGVGPAPLAAGNGSKNGIGTGAGDPNGAGATDGTGGDTPDAPPATAEPACKHPEGAAKMLESVTPERPPEAEGKAGTVRVAVKLSAQSDIVSVAIYQSSGIDALDKTALDTARRSRFQTARHLCVDIPNTYIFRVYFAAE